MSVSDITRELGRSGIVIPPFSFGGHVFGQTVDQATSLEQVAELASATRLVLPVEDIELLNRASRY